MTSSFCTSTDVECTVDPVDPYSTPVVAQTITVSASQSPSNQLECSETLPTDLDSGDEPQVQQPDSTTDIMPLFGLFPQYMPQSLYPTADCHTAVGGTSGTHAGPLLSNVTLTSPCLFPSPTVTAVPSATSPEFFQPNIHHIHQSPASFADILPFNVPFGYSPAPSNYTVFH